MSKKVAYLSLLFILLAGGFFRLYRLDSVPPGIHPDVAVNALDAWNAYKNQHHQVFYESNFGREGLFINLISFSFQLFGPTIISLKLPGALLGLCSILGMYFLGKEVTRKRYGGLIASFAIAISFWIIIFDRMGLRATLSLTCVVWTSFFFVKAIKTQRWYDYSLAGVLLGIGLHGYTSFRFMPIVLVFGLIGSVMLTRTIQSISFWKSLGQHRNFVFTVLISVIIFAPLGFFFSQNPHFFLSRSNEVSVFTQPNSFHLLTESTYKHFLFFNVLGDPNWRHNVSKMPALDMFQGLLFVFGFMVSVAGLSRRKLLSIPVSPDQRSSLLFLIILFLLMIVPAAITNTPGGIPHALRIINTAPAVFVFIGIAGVFLFEYGKSIISKRVFVPAILVIVTILIAHNAALLFNRWGKNGQVAHEFSQDYMELSKFISSEARQGKNVLVVTDATEMQFLLLDTPHVDVKADFSSSIILVNSLDLVVFSNFNESQKQYSDQLTLEEWGSSLRRDFGRGNHTIMIFEKNNNSKKI